jgi:hypothetical protein
MQTSARSNSSRGSRDGRSKHRSPATGGIPTSAFRARHPRIKLKDLVPSIRDKIRMIYQTDQPVPDLRAALLRVPGVVACEDRKEQSDPGFVVYIATETNGRGVSIFTSEKRLRASSEAAVPSSEARTMAATA